MLKARAVVEFEFNIFETGDLEDEIVIKALEAEVTKHVQEMWKKGQLDTRYAMMSTFKVYPMIKSLK